MLQRDVPQIRRHQAMATTIGALLHALNQCSHLHSKQDAQLAAIEAYISQPQVLTQILNEETRIAQYERLDISLRDPPVVWVSERYNNLFYFAIESGIDIVPFFFSPPWATRIPCTLRHFLSRMVDAAVRRPNRLELLELMLNSAPFRGGDVPSQLHALWRRLPPTRRQDSDLRSLFVAHGLEERSCCDCGEEAAVQEAEQAPHEEIASRMALAVLDDRSDY